LASRFTWSMPNVRSARVARTSASAWLGDDQSEFTFLPPKNIECDC
jgi:hypothetical protein